MEFKSHCLYLLKEDRSSLEGLWIVFQPVTPTEKDMNVLRNEILTKQEWLQQLVANDPFWLEFYTRGVTVCVRPQQHSLLYGNRRLV